ncbi:hypothetical protein L596_021066 [Steinernema carpocapsae]|nr:hypothetical protein L596_021066 [Steinernema carpocapsae]
MTASLLKESKFQCCKRVSPRTITVVIGVLTIASSLFGCFSSQDELSPVFMRTTVTIHNVILIFLAFLLIVGAKNRKPFLLLPYLTYLVILACFVLGIDILTVYGQLNVDWVIKMTHAEVDSSENIEYNTRLDLCTSTIIFSILALILIWFVDVIVTCYATFRQEQILKKATVVIQKI